MEWLCRAKALVEGGKGVTSNRSHLGSEVTHVVCHPEAATSWLAMGERFTCVLLSDFADGM